MATPIVLEGKQVGRLTASWLLFKESWRFLSLDREMLWVSPITIALDIFLLGIIFGAVVIVSISSGVALDGAQISKGMMYAMVFAVYVAGAFSLSLGQAAIVHTVYTRIHGGDATLGQSLRVAFAHSGALFLWSCITSTVGLILQALSRHKLLGYIVAVILGAAWGVLTYFVVPAMVLDKKSAFGSIARSTSVFKQTWGETLVSNFSLGATFFLAHVLVLLSFIGLAVVSLSSQNIPMFLVVCTLVIVWIVLSSVIHSTLNAVLRTLLYIYATENIVPQNFNPELLSAMLYRRTQTPVAVLASQPTGDQVMQ
jgi:hypothetical protein